MPETEFVTDIMQPDDPELNNLVSLRAVAAYWKTQEEYVRRRLRESSVRLIRIDHPLMVRWSDVQEFEKAHTIILGSKSDPKAKQKEVVSTSRTP